MKTLKHCALCTIISFCMHLHTAAQGRSPVPSEPNLNKPALFAELPDSILLDVQHIDHLFGKPVNSVAKVEFAKNFSLQGTVVSVATDPQAPLSSVVVKSSNRLGAVLTLSRIQEAEGVVSFTGRIISRNHKDAFEVVENEGRYFLVKRSYYDLNVE